MRQLETSVQSIIFTSKQLLKIPTDNEADDEQEGKYRGGTAGKVDLDTLIRYSQLISHTTFEGVVGNPGLEGLYQLPMPAEQQIQNGILYRASGAPGPEATEDQSRLTDQVHSPSAMGDSDLFAPVCVIQMPTEIVFPVLTLLL